jgi:ApbE superfamily uncharacterized protein (UPF0280 family)
MGTHPDNSDLKFFVVQVKETLLSIHAQQNLKEKALKVVLKYRDDIECHIDKYPEFLVSFEPLPIQESIPDIPDIIKQMLSAARSASVGPMAAVAGSIAEHVGKELLPFSPEIIVGNGGDIFMATKKTRNIKIYAGNSPLTEKIALEIAPEDSPLGICTSSGTFGHSFSFGKADAVIVIAPSASLADASATAIGNIVADAKHIPKAIEFARKIEGLTGVAIIKDSEIKSWGKVKIVSLE